MKSFLPTKFWIIFPCRLELKIAYIIQLYIFSLKLQCKFLEERNRNFYFFLFKPEHLAEDLNSSGQLLVFKKS